MKEISCSVIKEGVKALCAKAAFTLPGDVLLLLERAEKKETLSRAKNLLHVCIKNAEIAHSEKMPVCQDTGSAVFFVEAGNMVKITGGLLTDAIQEGTREGYTSHYLRSSVINDPVFTRQNTKDNTPAVIHFFPVEGDTLKIILAPKGGGSENMSQIAMLSPTGGREAVEDFVIHTVISAGGNPCPPLIVGVGIGGTFEYAALLAKKALLRTPAGSPSPESRYAGLERTILDRINERGSGPQGLGGRTTALAVHIEYYPCHIASLPVAVNMNCHAARHAELIL